MRLEARRGVTRPKKWRRWVSYANLTRLVWLIAVPAIVAWCAEGLYRSCLLVGGVGAGKAAVLVRLSELLQPGMQAGTSLPPVPGSTCLPDCKLQL